MDRPNLLTLHRLFEYEAGEVSAFLQDTPPVRRNVISTAPSPVLKVPECPVCFEVMTPPTRIHMCK